jgi:general secretion pathway protein D
VKQLQDLLRIESIPFLKPREQARGVYLFPIERLREIYVFASSQEWLDRILFHVDNLDRPEALGGEVRTYLYFPMNTSAADLGKTVGYIFGQSIAGGERPAQAGAQTPAAGQPQAGQPMGAQSQQLQATNKIIIDESRNCLIFVISPSEWATIQDLLEKLDIPAKQVLVEALIGELTLDDQFRMGFEWFVKNQNIKINNKNFSGEGGTSGGLGLGSVGFLYTLVASDDMFKAAFNAFISQNKINIISAPRIICIDNKESQIKVGTEVPVVTSEAVTGQLQTQGTTALLRSIQYRSTGVLLTVKPTIHSGGVVALDITQEVSEAQTNTISSEIQSPLILNRSIKTSLIAKNGETIFIGGLISKNISSTTTAVPILSKIPLIGALFKSQSQSERRTELIVLITPHILSEGTELDYLTDEFRLKLLPEIMKFSVKEVKKDAHEKQ